MGSNILLSFLRRLNQDIRIVHQSPDDGGNIPGIRFLCRRIAPRAGQNSFPGSIDEVRISKVARSADWVKASHDTVTESAFAVYSAAKENGRKGMMIFIR